MLDGMRKTQNFKRNQQQTWAAVLGEGRDGLTPINYHCVPENSRKSNEKGNCEEGELAQRLRAPVALPGCRFESQHPHGEELTTIDPEPQSQGIPCLLLCSTGMNMVHGHIRR